MAFDAVLSAFSSLGALPLLGGSVFIRLTFGIGSGAVPRWFAASSPFGSVLGFAGLGWLGGEDFSKKDQLYDGQVSRGRQTKLSGHGHA